MVLLAILIAAPSYVYASTPLLLSVPRVAPVISLLEIVMVELKCPDAYIAQLPCN